MRNFGISKEATNLYNLKRRSIRMAVGIADQCAKPYFYSRNVSIEKAIGSTEGEASSIIREMINNGEVPRHNTIQHHQLMSFVALQHGRTLGAAKAIEDFYNNVGKKIIKESIIAKGDKDDILKYLPGVRLVKTNSTLENILQFSLMAPLLRDLRFEVLEAGRDQDFLLGDDPVVLSNKYLFNHNGGPNCGFSIKGLIVLMPISPKKLIMLNDPNAYEEISRVRLNKEQTISFNKLQLRHAVSNVYFQDRLLVEDTLTACADLEPFARETDATVGPFEQDGRKGIYMAHSREAMPMPREFDLRIKFSAKRYRNRAKVDPVRNREMAAMVDMVMYDPELLKGENIV